MFYLKFPAAHVNCRNSYARKFPLISRLLLLLAAFGSLAGQVSAQAYQQELETGEKVSVSVKSSNGRVSVIASDERKKNVTIEASSAGASIDSTEAPAELASIVTFFFRSSDAITLTRPLLLLTETETFSPVSSSCW